MTNNDAIMMAHKLGYVVSRNGKKVTSPAGNVLTLRIRKSGYNGNGYAIFSAKIGNHHDGRPIIHPIKVYRLQAYVKFGKKCFNKKKMVYHISGNCHNDGWANIGLKTKVVRTPEERRVRNLKLRKKRRDALVAKTGKSYRASIRELKTMG